MSSSNHHKDMRRLAAVLGILMTTAPVWAESAGGIRWSAPDGWTNLGSRPMRAATYRIPAAAGDKEGGECAVYYFGPGQGGGVDANVKRWIGQFELAGGQAAAPAKQRTVNGVSVTTIDVAGTYLGAGGPMMARKIKKPGYRLLGAIAAGPQGNVFFKLTGPTKTVAATEQQFEELLQSIQR